MYIYIYAGCFYCFVILFYYFFVVVLLFFDWGAIIGSVEGCMGSGPGVPGPGNGRFAPILATKPQRDRRETENKRWCMQSRSFILSPISL